MPKRGRRPDMAVPTLALRFRGFCWTRSSGIHRIVGRGWSQRVDYQLNLIDIEGEISEASMIGAAIAVAVVFLTFLFGGWVAGRMSRFDGGKNGMGAGLWLLVFAAIFALLGAWVGPEFNAFGTAGLPDWFSAIRSDVRTTNGLILAAVFAVAALLGGYAGGRIGERYNQRVDTSLVHSADGTVVTDRTVIRTDT